MASPVLQHQDYGGVSHLQNLPAPAGANEPARLTDLQAAIEGLNWKDNVRVRVTSNVNLASPGATLDGVTFAAGDVNKRVLLTAQTTASANGIYDWNGAAVPMTRSADANTAAELLNAIAVVDEGTSGGASFRQTTTGITLDTTPLVWGSFGTGAGPASETSSGIAELATQTETDTGTDDLRIVTPFKLANYASRFRTFLATIGDGSATQYDVTHNFGTRDVEVQIWETAGSFRRVDAGLEISAPTINSVRVNFAAAPASGAYRVVVHR
jgi:hypothetical protein